MLTVSPVPGVLDLPPVKPDAGGGAGFAPLMAGLLGPKVTAGCTSLPPGGENLPAAALPPGGFTPPSALAAGAAPPTLAAAGVMADPPLPATAAPPRFARPLQIADLPPEPVAVDAPMVTPATVAARRAALLATVVQTLPRIAVPRRSEPAADVTPDIGAAPAPSGNAARSGRKSPSPTKEEANAAVTSAAAPVQPPVAAGVPVPPPTGVAPAPPRRTGKPEPAQRPVAFAALTGAACAPVPEISTDPVASKTGTLPLAATPPIAAPAPELRTTNKPGTPASSAPAAVARSLPAAAAPEPQAMANPVADTVPTARAAAAQAPGLAANALLPVETTMPANAAIPVRVDNRQDMPDTPPAALTQAGSAPPPHRQGTPEPSATETPIAARPPLAANAAPVILPALQAFGAAIRRAMADERKPIPPRDGPNLGLVLPAGTTAPAPAQTVAPSNATLDTTDRRWPHAMAEQIEKLRDAADAQSTRIRLLPDALGPVGVAVRRDGEQVHVHFTAADAQTRQLLADAQPRLADAAEARGVKLGRTDVSGGDSSGGGGQQQRPAAQDQQPSRPAPARTRAAAADTDDSRLA